MESQQNQEVATEQQKELIQRHLGTQGVIIDEKFKGSVMLKESQAKRRAELISDVEYTFSLALNHGEHYLG